MFYFLVLVRLGKWNILIIWCYCHDYIKHNVNALRTYEKTCGLVKDEKFELPSSSYSGWIVALW